MLDRRSIIGGALIFAAAPTVGCSQTDEPASHIPNIGGDPVAAARALRLVTDKPPSQVMGGDSRYYVSQSPYYWQTPRGWKAVDGLTNPAAARFSNQADFRGVCDFIRQCGALSDSKNDPRYGQALSIAVDRWFLDESSAMLPSFRYAKIIPGKREQDNPFGLLDARPLIWPATILGVGLIDKDREAALKNWLRRYSAESGQAKFVTPLVLKGNNHLTWYLAHQIAIAVALGDAPALNRLSEMAGKAVLNQTSSGGAPKMELRRSKAISYTMFNARGWICILSLLRIAGGVMPNRGAAEQMIEYAMDVAKANPRDQNARGVTLGAALLGQSSITRERFLSLDHLV